MSILYLFNDYQEVCTQSVLYKESGLKKSTVNSALRKMEREELLYVTPGTGRNTQVFLTEKGKQLMENTVYRMIEIENEIYNAWTSQEQELFMRLNRDFAEKLKERVGEL